MPRPNRRAPATNVFVVPFGQLAESLLGKRRRRSPPASVALVHAWASAEELELNPDSYERIAVWGRVIWPDKTETLGWISCTDGELIWALWPERTFRLTRVIGCGLGTRRSKIDETSN